VALKFGCKFVETSVAINDKVDDLLAGILKQIRLKESSITNNREHDTNINENDEINTTSFIENSNAHRTHVRNYSDANVDDFIKEKDNHKNNQFFKSNTLSRRLFRNKNKENTNSFLNKDNNNNNSDNMYFDNKKNKLLKISFTDQQSFFHKLFNNFFKKRSNLSSHLQSVENLYTPPSKN
jgi:hypothetical protein